MRLRWRLDYAFEKIIQPLVQELSALAQRLLYNSPRKNCHLFRDNYNQNRNGAIRRSAKDILSRGSSQLTSAIWRTNSDRCPTDKVKEAALTANTSLLQGNSPQKRFITTIQSLPSSDVVRTHGRRLAQEYRLRLKRPAPSLG
jgi:hypothetical protein